ncbi:MAG: hypothetical protein ACR2HF_02730 [Methylococcaceae bacterium]
MKEMVAVLVLLRLYEIRRIDDDALLKPLCSVGHEWRVIGN